MITLAKASAGSGKTFTLALEYIRLLLQSQDEAAYRHILAVTFTNKATDEMKSRILEELFKLSTEPGKSKYTAHLVPIPCKDVPTLQKAASRRLHSILHDYSAFSVSTIDRFFQQTLKAFAREIGQFSSYQIELDKESLVEETVARILDGVTKDDTALRRWLRESVMEQLSEGKRFNLDNALAEMASSLKSSGHDSVIRRYGIDEEKVYSRENLSKIRKACDEIIERFESEISEKAAIVLKTLSQAGVEPEDFNRGFLKVLRKYADEGLSEPPTEAFVRKAANQEEWFAKKNAHLLPRVEGKLEKPLEDFVAVFDNSKEYITAKILRAQLYSLGIARELGEVWTRIQKEKNIMFLEDSNAILKNIIDGSDAPFVYEKTGSRYEHFLLDEFQDTSRIQWDNFKPLLENSEASGNDNLIVGDVKQSIYRWRGSDWNLLNSEIAKQFKSIKDDPHRENWRTLPVIVDFNNNFFADAARGLDVRFGKDLFSQIYSDVRQEAKKGSADDGYVEAVFVEDSEAVMKELFSTVDSILDAGGNYGDITILVRGNREGADIAAALIERNIPVVSDDSLYVKTSVTVRQLVSQLSLLISTKPGKGESISSFMASSQGICPPSSYHSLQDLAESLLRQIKAAYPESFNAEIPYINAFMDFLSDRVAVNGNDLDAFLADWEAADPKIACPGDGNSVRVMTIHKSKGLEFNYVIFPFAEKVVLYKAPTQWCRPSIENTAFEGVAEGAFNVELNSSAENSLFSEDFQREQLMQAIDNLNIFYVALTRARSGLTIIAGKSRTESFADILKEYLGTEHYVKGSLKKDYFETKEKSVSTIRLDYPSFDHNERNFFLFSPEAADFFGEDGTVGMDASARILGNVMHRILSGVMVPSDLPREIERAVSRGELQNSERGHVTALLEEKLSLAASRGWFSPDAVVLSERDIVDGNGNVYRPDRVEIHGSVAEIIDYKFGEPSPRYRKQISRYAALLGSLGYTVSRATLWYVLTDNFDEV